PARLLAAARRPSRPDGLRPGPQGLRDLDGREARARPRVHRRPVAAPLPAHARRDRVARAQAVPARPRARALDVEPRVLEVEVSLDLVHDLVVDDPGAAQLDDGPALGLEQLAPQPLVVGGARLDRAVVLAVEARGEAVTAEAVHPAHPLRGALAHPR